MFQCCLIIIFLAPGVLAFKDCDTTKKLAPGTYTLKSPDYPKNYSAGSSCRYHFIAPLDYKIKVVCDIQLPVNNCTDRLYVDVEGDYQLRHSDYYCNKTTANKISAYGELVVLYKSRGKQGGRFQCTLTAFKQKCKCGWSAEIGRQRVLGGTKAKVGEFPSMVAFIRMDYNGSRFNYCGGSIVTHRIILTYRTCVSYEGEPLYKDRYIIAGSVNIENPASSIYYKEYRIKNTHIHYSMGIVETTENIVWNYGVGPACLPPSDTKTKFIHETVELAAFGYDNIHGPHSDGLQKINMMVTTCDRNYWLCVLDHMKGGRDICDYDTGGAIYLRKGKLFLIGFLHVPADCQQKYIYISNLPRITNYIDWLITWLGDDYCKVEIY